MQRLQTRNTLLGGGLSVLQKKEAHSNTHSVQHIQSLNYQLIYGEWSPFNGREALCPYSSNPAQRFV